jgi:hypothetical protein
MYTLKLVSTIRAEKLFYEFPNIKVTGGSWKAVDTSNEEFNGRAFIVTDEEFADKGLCKPNVFMPDIFLDEPEDGKITNIVIGMDDNGLKLHTLVINDGGYEGYIMQYGKTIDRL